MYTAIVLSKMNINELIKDVNYFGWNKSTLNKIKNN